MKNQFLLILLVCIGLSCNESNNETIVASYGNGNPMKIVVTNEEGVKIEERSFYDNKQLYTDWVFNDNKIHGTCRSFYKNGNPWSERNYNLGVLHGGYKNWHENGQLYMVGQFKDGKKEGVWLFYDTSGKKTKTINFNNSGDSTLVS